MKLPFILLYIVQALVCVNANSINWYEYSYDNGLSAGVVLADTNGLLLQLSKGGCAVAVVGAVGAALGFAICTLGPQAATCAVSSTPAWLAGFLTNAFTMAAYECGDLSKFQGMSSKDLRCKAAKIIVENKHKNVTPNNEIRSVYNKCF